MYQSPFPSTTAMPITPSLTWPMNTLSAASPQPVQGPQLTKVNGMDSAKAFPTVANAMYALFDANDDVMYIKSTDASNYPTIKRYRFVLEEEKPIMPVQYVTVEEFNKFKEELLNAKQSIRDESKPNKSKWNSNGSSGSNQANGGNA